MEGGWHRYHKENAVIAQNNNGTLENVRCQKTDVINPITRMKIEDRRDDMALAKSLKEVWE